MQYAYEVVLDPEKMTVIDRLTLHALGVGEESVLRELPYTPKRTIVNGPPLGRLHREPPV